MQRFTIQDLSFENEGNLRPQEAALQSETSQNTKIIFYYLIIRNKLHRL